MSKLPRSAALISLLSLPDAQFVQACYRLVLFREIDPEGMSHTLSRLVAGEDKLAVAADIACSQEARALPVTKRELAMEILALRAESLVTGAWTRKQRDAAARQIHHYFSGLAAPPEEAPEAAPKSKGDPFSAYLENVIHDRS